MPLSLVESGRRYYFHQLSQDEVDGILLIGKYKWGELTSDILEANADSISLVAPEAFAYYLPDVIMATIKDDCRNTVTAVPVVSMLDRTPNRQLWDYHFLQDGRSFLKGELFAIAEWIAWLADCGDFALDETSLIRALENLDLLSERAELSHS